MSCFSRSLRLAVCYLLWAICCLLFSICCSQFAVRYFLFAVWCLMFIWRQICASTWRQTCAFICAGDFFRMSRFFRISWFFVEFPRTPEVLICHSVFSFFFFLFPFLFCLGFNLYSFANLRLWKKVAVSRRRRGVHDSSINSSKEISLGPAE